MIDFLLIPEVLTIVMLVGVMVGKMIGYPLAIPVGAFALIFGYLIFGAGTFGLFYHRFFAIISSPVLLAIPLFVFMGGMMERAGIVEKMFDALYLWLGGLRGGLGIVTVIVGVILAACVGVIGASVTVLGLIALPAMVKRGYSKSLASGIVCAAGTLGILIPPSVMIIIYGPMAGISVGKLFMAAFIPGLILAGLYIAYTAIHCYLQPGAGPAVSPEERAAPLSKKISVLLTSLIPPGFIILSVLGVIFFGIAPPTEAGAMGAVAATILAIAYRKFSLNVLKEVAIQTLKISSMILLIGGTSFAFVGVFIPAGGGEVIGEVIMAAPGGRWGAFAVVMLLIFALGFIVDWIGIVFIMVPILAPVIIELGFDPVWFAMMVIINLQIAFMTPPFAPAIFYLVGVAPPESGVTMSDCIRGVWVFVAMIIIGMGLFIAFPQLILWLPAILI
jgi:tripartite ATP-independent transporter DctM subunit